MDDNMKTKTILFLIFFSISIVSAFLIGYNKRKPSCDLEHVLMIERIKTDSLRLNYEQSMQHYKDSINKVNTTREVIKWKYKDRIISIPASDTCGRCYAERDYLQQDNQLLEKTVQYYSNALNECDSQFSSLVDYANKLDSAKTAIITYQVDELEAMRAMQDELKNKVKRKNKSIAWLISGLTIENTLIGLILAY